VGASALALLLRAYRAVTPDPPPPGAAIALRDPADASIGFSAARTPRALRAAALAGALLLAAVLAAGALGLAGPRRPVPPAPEPAAPRLAPPEGDRGGAPPGRGS
jgi:hypothetical protein